MEEFIKSLKLEASTENALLGAFSQEKQTWNKQIEDTKATAIKEKEKVEKDLKEFKESVKDYDLVKKDLKTLKENEATLLKEKDDAIKSNKDLKIDFALTNALKEAGAKHPNLIKKDIDISNLDIDENGKVTGIEEAVNGAKESYTDMFGAQQTSSAKSATKTNGIKDKKSIQNWSKDDYKKFLGLDD